MEFLFSVIDLLNKFYVQKLVKIELGKKLDFCEKTLFWLG